MIPEKLSQVLENEGVVAIATQGPDGPHLVNTWNSYVRVTEDDRMIIPVGGMNETEENIERNNAVRLTLGSKEVEGFHGKGTGFLIEGKADFLKQGADYDKVKNRFPWARAALEVTLESVDQKI